MTDHHNYIFINQDAYPWSEQHKDSMEAMPQDVAEGIPDAIVGGSYVLAESSN